MTIRSLFVVVVVLCGSLSALSSARQQASPGDTQAGSIEGRVMTADPQPQPIRRARVGLTSTSGGPERLLLTDDAGRFVFDGLPPGRFGITAARPAFLPAGLSALRPGGAGTPFALAPGQRMTGILLRMIRGGVITGTVRDTSSSALPGVPVSVRSVETQGDVRKLAAVAGVETSVTDDTGAYRIYGLAPGEYVVVAVPSVVSQRGGGTPLAPATPAGAGSQRSTTVAYSRVYCPGTGSPDEAMPIRVGAGSERAGVDLQVQLVPTLRLEGSVENPLGVALEKVSVWIDPAGTIDSVETPILAVTNDGKGFAAASVPPGRYHLWALAPAQGSSSEFGPGRYWAGTDVTVGDADQTGIVLSLRPGVELSGRVEFRGSMGVSPSPSVSAPSPAGILLRLINADTSRSHFAPATTTGQDGTFSFGGIAGGRFQISVPDRAGWILHSITGVGDLDLVDTPLIVDGSTASLKILVVYTNGTTELAGTLFDAAGTGASRHLVVAASVNPALRSGQSRRIQTARPGTDGRYSITGLPAGDYFLAVIEDIESGQVSDAGFLSALERSAVKVTLRDGQTTTQDIKMLR